MRKELPSGRRYLPHAKQKSLNSPISTYFHMLLYSYGYGAEGVFPDAPALGARRF